MRCIALEIPALYLWFSLDQSGSTTTINRWITIYIIHRGCNFDDPLTFSLLCLFSLVKYHQIYWIEASILGEDIHGAKGGHQ